MSGRTIYINKNSLVCCLIIIFLLVNDYVFKLITHNESSSLSSIFCRGNAKTSPELSLPQPDPDYISIPKINFKVRANPNEVFRTYYGKTVQPPGIIVRTKGGLGNQLFQYACSYTLARDLNFPLYIWYDESMSSQRQFGPHRRDFALDKFQIPLDNFVNGSTIFRNLSFLSDEDILDNIFLFRFRDNLRTKFLTLGGDAYCQSIEYFVDYRNDIKSMFRPTRDILESKEMLLMLDKIKTTESVAVHVRQGDYLATDGYLVPISFQRRAIRKLAKILEEQFRIKPVFYVFSDDIQYAADSLQDFEEYYELIYVSRTMENSTNVHELFLMSKCKHNIFPDSTFGWWSAMLNENSRKIVISSTFNPRFFIRKTKRPTERRIFYGRLYGTLFHPKDWIVINPFTGVLESLD